MRIFVILTALTLASFQVKAVDMPAKGNYSCSADRAWSGGHVVVSTSDSIHIALGASGGYPLAYVYNTEKRSGASLLFGGVGSKMAKPNKQKLAVSLPVNPGNQILGTTAARLNLTENLVSEKEVRMFAYILYYYGDAHWERRYVCIRK